MRWVPGVVGVSIHRGRGRTTAPSVRYAVELSRGQKRQRVTLDQLRPPLREDTRLGRFGPHRRQGAFLAATIGGAHASTATLGYKVLLAGTALPVPGVPASHLRRVFVAGDAVLVYRGPAAGWASAEVVAEPVAGGKQAALLMPDFVGGGGWLEAGVQIVPNRSGKRVNSMGSIGSMGSMPPSMRTVDSAADSPDSPVYARRSSAGSIWKLPSRRKSTESVRGSPSRRIGAPTASASRPAAGAAAATSAARPAAGTAPTASAARPAAGAAAATSAGVPPPPAAPRARRCRACCRAAGCPT
ncbi:unnamed protein product [Prorocentrum cordatum]|uniref:Uncharacterized protein n=1 Tax=Prorocentrum cordatum TaxID=2364126 RepID=A0ABN9ULI4_9DINO|nr:unnamed protein product [Polarella glacialis]